MHLPLPTSVLTCVLKMASPGGFEGCLSSHETTTNADVTVKQHEPSYELHKAVFHGDHQRVKELLEAGADPNEQDKHGILLGP